MAWRDRGAFDVAMAGMIAIFQALARRRSGQIREQTMASAATGQWSTRCAVLAVLGLPLAHVPSITQLVSWECGPGYHKPRFGRCVPDIGVPLVRRGRYSLVHTGHHARSLPPIRSMGPWGPRVNG
jgi:hypothetical protein